MYKIIEQTVLSNITDTNDVAQTTTDPEMDPYDTLRIIRMSTTMIIANGDLF